MVVECAFVKDKRNKVVLVILAHPDDETTIGPMMARYARLGKVYYIVRQLGVERPG
ncbi:MAG: hypothetical protein JST68_12375 [Bacteroidetes bacterium]|nr:hypothetical protein [Bacteroidota bacterium]